MLIFKLYASLIDVALLYDVKLYNVKVSHPLKNQLC